MLPRVELEKDPLNLVIIGVGGQGSLMASQVLGQLLVGQGLVVTIGETLGLSQRGGTVVSQLRISAADELGGFIPERPGGARGPELSPVIPQGRGHLIVALEPVEGLRALARFGNPEIDLLMNTRPVYPLGVLAGEETYPEQEVIVHTARDLCRRLWLVDASELALGLGDARLANTAMLGALFGLGLLPAHVEPGALREALCQVLPATQVELNLVAFERGVEAVKKR